MRRVACVSVPNAGHTYPVLKIARCLAYRGYDVVLYCVDSVKHKCEEKCVDSGIEVQSLECAHTVEEMLQEAIKQDVPPFGL